MRDRERPVRRRRPVGLLLFLALLGALLLYFRCGDGLGLGLGLWPGEEGASDPDRSAAEVRDEVVPATGELRPAVGGEVPPARRCQLRLDGGGLTVDGESTDATGAVARCRTAGAADLVVTGDAVYGQLESLRAALEGAGVPVFVRDTTGRAGQARDAGAGGAHDTGGASGPAAGGGAEDIGGAAAGGGAGAGGADDTDG